MAVIGKIRRRSGLLILIIGLAMLAFILGDIFGSGGVGGGQQFREVGSVDGVEITDQELEARTQYWTEIYATGYNQNITNEQARNLAWSELIKEKVLMTEIDRAGLKFTDEEFDDVRFGEGALEEFKSNYKGEDGQFDPEIVKQSYMRLFNERPSVWQAEKRRLSQKRLSDKYNALVKGTIGANSLEAADSYLAKNSSIDINYALKSYSSIADSSVVVSDSDINSYFNAHKSEERFKQSAARDMELVVFNVEPTPGDIALIEEDIIAYKDEFKNAINDSLFSIVNSDLNRYSVLSYTKAEFDSTATADVFAANVGDVVGPYNDGLVFRIYKVLGDDAKEEATVRHILIESKDPSADAEKKSRADSILRAIKRGADFEALVERYTDDPGSKTNGGKYEWFPRGQMVPEFENFSFDKPKGSKGVVKTNFGYHIIEVLDQRSEPMRKVAEFVKNIEPSSETFDVVYDEASAFALDNKDLDSFMASANEKGYQVKSAINIVPGARGAGGVNNARELVRWSYDSKREVGDISNPIEIENQFVVAILTGAREDGEPELADIEDQVRTEVLKDLKAAMIIKQVGSYASVQDAAASMGVTVKNQAGISLNSPSIPGAGNEPEVIGTAFGYEPGDVLTPLKGNSGVYVIEIANKKEATLDNVDLSAELESLDTRIKNTVTNQLGAALNKAKGVKNEIDRVY